MLSGSWTPPRGGRPLAGGRQAFGPGWRGRLWLGRQPLALVRGLRLRLVWALPGRPGAFALTGAKAVDQQVLWDLVVEPQLVAARPGQLLVADKHHHGREFETVPGELGVRLLGRPLRQLIESVNATCNGQLDPEQHGGTPGGVGSGSCSASSLSPPRSGTTTTPASPPGAH